MSELIKTAQIKPLNHAVAGIWDYESSDYPDRVKIPMEDGQVISYIREIEQPHPKCLKSIDLIKNMNSCTFGGTKPRRRNRK